MNKQHFKLRQITLAIALGLSVIGAAQAGAGIQVISRDEPGVGFNDTTPVAPVGGNTGTTLGAQRMQVYEKVAAYWASQLTNSVPITVSTAWESLGCTEDSAVLGSAGAWNGWYAFPGNPTPNTWYPAALANKLAGVNLSEGNADDGTGYANVDIKAQFNIDLGTPGCMDGAAWYLGLDHNHGSKIDFAVTLLHELGHGLGFSTQTDGETGQQFLGLPSAWDRFLLDNSTGKTWVEMADWERAASAVAGDHLVWIGTKVTAAIPSVLNSSAAPTLRITAPVSAVRDLEVGAATFGAPAPYPATTLELMPVVDQADGVTGLACTELNRNNALAVRGHFALVDSGGCSFPTKVKNAQNAGALAVLVVDNVPGTIPPVVDGSDASITIPVGSVTQAEGVKLKQLLNKRSRTHSGVFLAFGLHTGQRAGTDSMGRALMYTPNSFISNSSVSHFDSSAIPNLLMEPSVSGELRLIVKPPKDLTLPLLQDIGW